MGNYLYVRVQFKQFKESEYGGYAFLFKYNKSNRAVYEGDLVVCETKYGIALGRVKDVNEDCPDKKFTNSNLKEIISVVDLTEYNERKAREEKAEQLKKEMQERMNKLKEIELIRMMSEKDETLKNMLQEYESLTGGN